MQPCEKSNTLEISQRIEKPVTLSENYPRERSKSQMVSRGVFVLLTWFVIYFCFVDAYIVLRGFIPYNLNSIQTLSTLLGVPIQLILTDFVNIFYIPLFRPDWFQRFQSWDKYLMYINGALFILLNIGFTGVIVLINRKKSRSTISLPRFFFLAYIETLFVFVIISGSSYLWEVRIWTLIHGNIGDLFLLYRMNPARGYLGSNLCFLIASCVSLLFFLAGERVTHGGTIFFHWCLAYAFLSGVQTLFLRDFIFITVTQEIFVAYFLHVLAAVLLSSLVYYAFNIGFFLYLIFFPEQMSWRGDWFFYLFNDVFFLLQNLGFAGVIFFLNRLQRDKHPPIKIVPFYYLSLLSTGFFHSVMILKWKDLWTQMPSHVYDSYAIGSVGYLVEGIIAPLNLCYFAVACVWIGLLLAYTRREGFLKQIRANLDTKSSEEIPKTGN